MKVRIALTVLFVIIAAGIVAAFLFMTTSEPSESADPARLPTTTLEIGGAELVVEIAETQEALRRGLSGRASLPENRGMLFVYQRPGYPSIWMKDMQFPIDIIWINEGGTVVDIKHSAQPASFPEAFRPQEKARYVLEVVAGFADTHNLSVGTQLASPNMPAE